MGAVKRLRGRSRLRLIVYLVLTGTGPDLLFRVTSGGPSRIIGPREGIGTQRTEREDEQCLP